jgi:hypothetical protein
MYLLQFFVYSMHILQLFRAYLHAYIAFFSSYNFRALLVILLFIFVYVILLLIGCRLDGVIRGIVLLTNDIKQRKTVNTLCYKNDFSYLDVTQTIFISITFECNQFLDFLSLKMFSLIKKKYKIHINFYFYCFIRCT